VVVDADGRLDPSARHFTSKAPARSVPSSANAHAGHRETCRRSVSRASSCERRFPSRPGRAPRLPPQAALAGNRRCSNGRGSHPRGSGNCAVGTPAQPGSSS
jgi:hypothetical protein